MESHTAANLIPGEHLLKQSDSKTSIIDDYWRVLQVFSIYRVMLTVTLFLLHALQAGNIGNFEPLLYLYVLLIYLMLSIVYSVNSFFRTTKYYNQVTIQIITDIVALILIIHSSGGMFSGLAILFLPIVAAASILTPGKISFLYTAFAVIGILLEQSYSFMYSSFENNNAFTQAGFTGIVLFTTSLVINLIYTKVLQSEDKRRQQLLTLEKIESSIITILQKMHTGVLVADANNKILMLNNAATKLLDTEDYPIDHPDALVPAPLAAALEQWRIRRTPTHVEFTYNFTNIIAEFVSIGEETNISTVIMLDDLTQQEQAAQKLKLMSLGRLAASIAHEIRNPLNAISHATQLLNETKLPDTETRLLEIIENNTIRTNKIIESVLYLSKSKPIEQKEIDLADWLNSFIAQFIVHGHQDANVEMKCEHDVQNVMFDTTHLQQIITNLCENGVRYSMQSVGEPYVLIHGGVFDGKTYLDIIDRGPGIEEENMKYLFEPFFTTESSGTGLGLFVARELAQANGAKLICNNTHPNGNCFRLYFAEGNANEN